MSFFFLGDQQNAIENQSSTAQRILPPEECLRRTQKLWDAEDSEERKTAATPTSEAGVPDKSSNPPKEPITSTAVVQEPAEASRLSLDAGMEKDVEETKSNSGSNPSSPNSSMQSDTKAQKKAADDDSTFRSEDSPEVQVLPVVEDTVEAGNGSSSSSSGASATSSDHE